MFFEWCISLGIVLGGFAMMVLFAVALAKFPIWVVTSMMIGFLTVACHIVRMES